MSGLPSRKSTPFADGTIEGADDAEEQVAADVLEMAAVGEPFARRRDVVGGALALGLHQDRQVVVVVAVPRRERLQQLQALAGRRHLDQHGGSVGRRRGEGVLTGVVALVGQDLTDRCFEQHLGAVGCGDGVGGRIEIEATGQRQGHDGVGRGDEAERVGRAVVALREVAVERVDDRVGHAVGRRRSIPLADARPARVGQHGGADGLEIGEQAIALDRRPRLFGAGGDQQIGLHLQAPRRCLAGDRCGAGDVFVRAVGATADQRRGDLERPVVGPGLGADGGTDAVGAVGGVRAVDQRLQLVEVDLDQLVVERTVVGSQIVGDLVGGVGDGLAPRRLQVHRHVVVVAEQAAGGADLGAHVADGGLAGGRDAVGAGSEVLDDRSGAALDGQHPGDLEDDVFRRRPAAERAGELDADHLRPADVEREAGHHVDGIGAADTDGNHAEPAGVGGVAVGADHHAAGERVVLEHDLVDDAAARPPEADAVLGADRSQEVVHLLVGVDGDAEVDAGADLGRDQVIAVHRAGHSRGGQAGGHELQQRHLRGGVLHGHAVGVEVVVRAAPLDGSAVGSSRWLSRIFSVSVSGRPKPARPAAQRAAKVSYTP